MYWKFLLTGSRSPFTGFDWAAKEGGWVTSLAAGVCQAGIHACREADLPYWMSHELWRIELADPVSNADHKVVATRARLLQRVEPWTEQTAQELARACIARTGEHAADELRDAGLMEEADRLTGQPPDAVAGIARDLLPALGGSRLEPAATLCGYLVDAVESLIHYPVATVAYIAAKAADQRSFPLGVDLYAAERAWQAAWLRDRLHLTVGA